MEFSRFVVIGAVFQNPQQLTNEPVFVDTVVLDNANSHHPAQLFYLKDGGQLNSFVLDKDAFLLLGTVASVCHRTKRIHLQDERVICYKRLITCSGPKNSNGISTNAALTILHALRCNGITAATLPEIAMLAQESGHPTFAHGPTTQLLGDHSLISEACLNQLEHNSPSNLSLGLSSAKNRLYQVHT